MNKLKNFLLENLIIKYILLELQKNNIKLTKRKKYNKI